MENLSTSIVILNYNGGEDVIECLESVRNIDYPSYEIIVVDNASTDNSVESIRKKFPEVKIIQNETNLGFAEGNNVGIREANSHYVMLLNDDAVVGKNILKDLTAAIEERKNIGMAGPTILYYNDPDRIWFAGGRVNLFGYLSNWGKGLARGSCSSARLVDFLSGCSVLIKKEVIDKIGLLDAEYFLYFEDVDFCFRAKKAGYECLYVPSPTVWHKVTPSWITNPVQAYYYTRNPIIVAKKNLTGWRKFVFILSQFFPLFPYYCFKFARRDARIVKYLLKGLKDGMAYYFFNKLNSVECEAVP
jgi:GT2 family glycosyltransferase